MREIVIDTETTGLDPNEGHRVIEIGCVELINHVATGAKFHKYLNPERDIPWESTQVHGLSRARLAKEPVFAEIAQELLDFLGDAHLVAHNAEFDFRFLNWELGRLGFQPLPPTRMIDTAALARRKFPGSPVGLDSLCTRFKIDNSARSVHGALLDALLLADCYSELLGGRQAGLELTGPKLAVAGPLVAPKTLRPPRLHQATAEELMAHEALVQRLKHPIWRSAG